MVFFFFQATLHNRVEEEEPVIAVTDNVFLLGGRYKMAAKPVIQSEAAKFSLPANLLQSLTKQITEKNREDGIMAESGFGMEDEERLKEAVLEDCFQAHMVSFMKNPYLYGKNQVRYFGFVTI